MKAREAKKFLSQGGNYLNALSAIVAIQGGYVERFLNLAFGLNLSGTFLQKAAQYVLLAGSIQLILLAERITPPTDAERYRILRKNLLARVEHTCTELLQAALPGDTRLTVELQQVHGETSDPFAYERRNITTRVDSLVHTPSYRMMDLFHGGCRSLLLLGEPGSGKTVILQDLCISLLKEAREDPESNIPVYLNFSGWSDGVGVDEWLSAQIQKRYPLTREEASSWLSSRRFILLIDGLDEIVDIEARGCYEVASLISLLVMRMANAMKCIPLRVCGSRS